MCLFCLRFLDKTKNEWEDRACFEKVAGKYDMVFMDYSANEKARSKTKNRQFAYLLNIFLIRTSEIKDFELKVRSVTMNTDIFHCSRRRT